MKNPRHDHTANHHQLITMLMNPFYTVTFDPGLFDDHELIVTEEQWIAANTRLIGELGPDAYLRQLLAVLKGDYPRETDQPVPRD